MSESKRISTYAGGFAIGPLLTFARGSGVSAQKLPPLLSLIAARLPFYYGWAMLAITVIGTFALYPDQTVGISAFNAYVLKDLGLSQTELSGSHMLATLIAGMTAMFAGAAMDRYGLAALAILTRNEGSTTPYTFAAAFEAATGVEVVGRNTM